MSIKNFLLGAFVGSVSGFLLVGSAQVFGIDEVNLAQSSLGYEFYFLLLAPGFLFGISTLLYFIHAHLFVSKTRQSVGWILSCIASYIVAVIFSMVQLDYLGEWVRFVVAGLIGAAGLVFSYHFLIHRVSFFTIVITILFGGVFALVILAPIPESIKLYVFYMVWQAGVFGLLVGSQKDVVFKK